MARKDGLESVCRRCHRAKFAASVGLKAYPVFPVDEVVAAYAAGFLDGEGSFRIRLPIAFEINATNTHRGVLDHLRSMFGGHIVRHARSDGKRKESWRWVLAGRAAIALAARLRKHLRIKADHARLFLEFVQAIPTYKLLHPGAIRQPLGEPLAHLFKSISDLNRRGPH